MSWAPRPRTWKLSGQSRAGLPIPLPPIKSLLPDPNREPSAYKAAALPIAPRRPVAGTAAHLWRRSEDNPAIVRPAGVEPASTWPSTRPVYQIAARAHGASGRSRTACLSLTRGPLCRVSYRGVAAHRGFEPRFPGSEPGVTAGWTNGHRVRKARVERAGREV